MEGWYHGCLTVVLAEQVVLSQKFGYTVKYAKAHVVRNEVDVHMWTLVLLFIKLWPCVAQLSCPALGHLEPIPRRGSLNPQISRTQGHSGGGSILDTVQPHSFRCVVFANCSP